MIFYSIIISILFALVFAVLLAFPFRRRVAGPFNGMLFLFFIIFLFTWSIGSWMEPVGPMLGGVSWLGYLLVAVLVMLLLGAMLPPSPGRSRIIRKSEIDENVKEREISQAVSVTIGIFFWIMVLILFGLGIYQMIG